MHVYVRGLKKITLCEKKSDLQWLLSLMEKCDSSPNSKEVIKRKNQDENAALETLFL